MTVARHVRSCIEHFDLKSGQSQYMRDYRTGKAGAHDADSFHQNIL
jgi:hypothetical protein